MPPPKEFRTYCQLYNEWKEEEGGNMYKNLREKMVQLIRDAKEAYVLTGAGMSTESGIPDFRSPQTGLWENVDPMKTSTVDVLMSDPEHFYRVGFKRFASLLEAEPNPGHYALAEMESLDLIKGVITQNIDSLHKRAGTRKVYEVHGHVRTCHCLACKKMYQMQEILDQIEAEIIPPRCKKCSSVLRPDIVLFGDSMPVDFYQAMGIVEKSCDLLLVVGSSLAVYPVATLPTMVEKLAIVNLEPTPFDSLAEVVIQEKSSKVLSDVLAGLKNQS